MRILAVSCVRNEGPHILEWISHHRALGIDHFLMYSNDCDDGTAEILELLQLSGVLTHVPLHNRGKKSIQWQALKQAEQHECVGRADWVLVTDCDEYLNLRAPLNTLQDLIDLLPPDTDAMAMPWRLFGNSGEIEAQTGLTIQRFVNAAPTDIKLPLAWFFKSLFRPGKFRQFGVHRPKRRTTETPNWVNGGGQALGSVFSQQDNRINLFGNPDPRSLVQLNHYSVRSAQEFMAKRERGLPNHVDREIGLGYWVERNFNSTKDDSILRHQTATQNELDKLMSVQGIAEILDRTNEKHRVQFEELMQKRENIQLFWHLGLSSSSEPPQAEFSRTQIARINNAN